MNEESGAMKSALRSVEYAALEARVATLEERIDKPVPADVGRLEKRIGGCEKLVEGLSQLEERIGRYRLMMMRNYVFTEVARSCFDPVERLQVSDAIRDCFDEDDEWWDQREDLSISDWRLALLGEISWKKAIARGRRREREFNVLERAQGEN